MKALSINSPTGGLVKGWAGRWGQLRRYVFATLSGQPKNTPKGRTFELRYFHHNAIQLYEIVYVSEINIVAILLYMTGACSSITVW
jgi:hypothetical protein